MKNVTLSKNAVIKDKELLKFIKKTQAIIQTSLQQELLCDLSKTSRYKTNKLSIGGVKKLDYNSLGAVVKNFVNKQYASSETLSIKRKLSKTNNLSQINRLNLSRSFGFSSNISTLSRFPSSPISRTNSASSVIKSKYDLYATKSVLNQIDLKSEFKGIKMKSLFTELNVTRIIKESAFLNFTKTSPLIGSSIGSSANKALKFNLHEVRCIDKTDEWSNDEIAAGAITTNDKGEVEKVREFLVANGFRDNIRKNYSPARVLKKFPLDADNIYPKRFLVFLNLAEKDSGGFSSFLSDMYEAIEAEMQLILSAIGVAAGAAIGAAIGGATGTAIGGPLGTLIGIAAGVILGAITAWLIDVFKDDLLFTEDFALIDIESRDFTFNGSLTSPEVSIDFYGHQDNSHYRAKYSWEIDQ